ncbi:glycosyltransferase [Vibrio cyclitrophicus]|uniref:glycosyltransferase n=1 Tax=Vibrio cyclitrophicus TaxID=47951 RepID=UPI00399B8D2F
MYRLIIMGGGPDEHELKDLSHKLGISDYVVFLGVVDDVYKYLSVSNLYLMTSVFEGMPLAICEAMIARKPMVVTNFKGVTEFVKDYYPIIEQNDSDKFGECMLEFKNLNLDSTIERARKDIIDYYSIDNVVNQWMQIYDK